MKSDRSIGWILHEGNRSGANNALLEYALILNREGFLQVFISPSPGTFTQLLTEKGFTVHIIPYYAWTRSPGKQPGILSGIRRFGRNLLAVGRIGRVIHSLEIICTHTLTTIPGALAARIHRKKHYWFIHEFGEEDHGFRLAINRKQAFRLVSFLSEKIVVNSKAVGTLWKSFVPREKVFLVYNAVTMDRMGQAGTSFPFIPFRLLLLGQIAPGKNQELAIRAFRYLEKEKYLLKIAGPVVDRSYLEHLRVRIREEDLQEQVILHPPVENVPEYLGSGHCLLVCSTREAFGRATVESLKCGIPVIAPRNGGSPEIIEEKINGLLYEPGNAESLAKAIRQMSREEIYGPVKNETARVNVKFNEEQTRVQLLKLFI